MPSPTVLVGEIGRAQALCMCMTAFGNVNLSFFSHACHSGESFAHDIFLRVGARMSCLAARGVRTFADRPPGRYGTCEVF